MRAASTNAASHFHSDSLLYYLFCAFLETKKMNNDERQVFWLVADANVFPKKYSDLYVCIV